MKKMIAEMRLKPRLIIAFSCFTVIPFLVIGGIFLWLYVSYNKEIIKDAAVQNNEQIIKNINTSLEPVISLSMYPIYNKEIFQLMKKDYRDYPYKGLEISRDFDTINHAIANNILNYSNVIDSAMIYQITNHLLIGRSNLEYVNHTYLNDEFFLQPYVREILKRKGSHVFVGIHADKLMAVKKKYVVSVGRSIIDPYTREDLGLVMLNLGVDKLKQLWSDISFTENTKFYLIDEQKNIIYSPNEAEISQNSKQVLPFDIDAIDQTGKYENKNVFALVSESSLSHWRAITIIPKNEMFSYLNFLLKIIFALLLLVLVLSIITAIFIATSITKPLASLEKKMREVSRGNLEVKVHIEHGEIGKISMTVDGMLQEIRMLIRRIYQEEQEKRNAELRALQSQINPHFMYNTINVIKWMAKLQGAAGIEEALTAFSSVIRFTAKTDSDYVTVKEELDFIQDYTKILGFRYLNKFEVLYEAGEEVLHCRTPKFMLQPLVENAVFHGFYDIAHKGKLIVRIEKSDENLVMSVIDNGKGLSVEQLDAIDSNNAEHKLNSIGISNIRKRIEMNFGIGYGLYLESTENQGTTARIVIPIMGQGNRGD
ncbi:sensor histidine kinase [Cohnella endophytica]|uniref:Sensor histidine kinase n=1 Tax=Cohnella endophytica TaxID=2419778 RepID=A0A494XV99_9BACL|nr:sensor histidine kinase [Cohnella endophytica]RKP51503.1 sensor histidine kinase [Cohnella endophytica]